MPSRPAKTTNPRDRTPRAWQRMLSGRRLDLLDPSPLDVEIEDIALGLSRVARWNGQTKGTWPFSVAQHSILVETLVCRLKPEVRQDWRLAALLHDAPEYVVGDLITPFKAVVGPNYKALEISLLRAIHLRFGLPAEMPSSAAALIKRADHMAAYLEATQLAGFSEAEANKIFGRPRDLTQIRLQARQPDEVKARFLALFDMLEKRARSAQSAQRP
jgi:5'-deoxynucleotidase YfbR-like HD superfamily hydrolase